MVRQTAGPVRPGGREECGLFGRVKLCVFGCKVPISLAGGVAELVQ